MSELAGLVRIEPKHKSRDYARIVASRELEEHGALDLRKLRPDDDLAWPDVGLEQCLEEFTRRHAPLTAPMGEHDGGIERDRASGVFRCRVGKREAAAERAAVADRRMGDVRRGLGKERRADEPRILVSRIAQRSPLYCDGTHRFGLLSSMSSLYHRAWPSKNVMFAPSLWRYSRLPAG